MDDLHQRKGVRAYPFVDDCVERFDSPIRPVRSENRTDRRDERRHCARAGSLQAAATDGCACVLSRGKTPFHRRTASTANDVSATPASGFVAALRQSRYPPGAVLRQAAWGWRRLPTVLR